MNLSTLEDVLWAAGFAGHVALFCVLLWRARWRTFPIFTALIGYQAVGTLVLFMVLRFASQRVYGVAYWTETAGDYAFQLALIYEIAKIVLRPTGTWIRDARRSFLLWSGVGVLLALGTAWQMRPDAASSLSVVEVRAEVFTSLLTCEVFFVMIATANRLGLQWRSHVMALGQGLTAWALLALMIDLAHVAMGWNRQFEALEYTRMWFYLGALAFWTVSFWMPERERAPISPGMHEYLLALHNRVQYDLDRLAAQKKSVL